MKKGLIVLGLMAVMVLSVFAGGVTAHPVHIKRYGTFDNNVFDNGRIKYEIHGLNAEIHTHYGRILVKDVHPEIWINDNGWEKIKYKEIRFFNYTSNGTHRVVVEAEHKGKIYSYMAIVYEEKTEFSLYRPLFPKLFITFNKTMKYKVKMVLENIKINHFLIIDNGTGYTEPPFKKGHMKHEIYNGTIKRKKEFREWQDIVIGYSEGKKKFGLNWEKYKGVYRNLKFEKGDSGINMEVESDPQEIKEDDVKTLGFPIPDTGGGGGGSGGGGGTPPTDTDKDGLSDNTEIAGWYAYWYDSSGVKHTKFVTSDPQNPDTDYDGANDYVEWKHLLNPRSTDTDGDGMPDGYEASHGVWHGGWQDPHWYNHRYAVIIVGGGYLDPYNSSIDSDQYYPAFWNDGLEMYNKLINDYNYKASNVYLLSSLWYSEYDGSKGWRGENPSTDSRVDGEAMWDSPTHYDIKDALDDISNKITIHDSLFIVIIAHGGPGGFLIRNDTPDSEAQNHPDRQGATIDYSNLGTYLNTKFGTGSNRKYAVMIVVNQACYSGTMISHLSGENRILITAADSTHEAYTEWGYPKYQHWAFIYQGRVYWPWETHDGFILSMGTIASPNSIEYCYEKGEDAAENNHGANSYPQIESSTLNPNKIYF